MSRNSCTGPSRRLLTSFLLALVAGSLPVVVLTVEPPPRTPRNESRPVPVPRDRSEPRARRLPAVLELPRVQASPGSAATGRPTDAPSSASTTSTTRACQLRARTVPTDDLRNQLGDEVGADEVAALNYVISRWAAHGTTGSDERDAAIALIVREVMSDGIRRGGAVVYPPGLEVEDVVRPPLGGIGGRVLPMARNMWSAASRLRGPYRVLVTRSGPRIVRLGEERVYRLRVVSGAGHGRARSRGAGPVLRPSYLPGQGAHGGCTQHRPGGARRSGPIPHQVRGARPVVRRTAVASARMAQPRRAHRSLGWHPAWVDRAGEPGLDGGERRGAHSQGRAEGDNRRLRPGGGAGFGVARPDHDHGPSTGLRRFRDSDAPWPVPSPTRTHRLHGEQRGRPRHRPGEPRRHVPDARGEGGLRGLLHVGRAPVGRRRLGAGHLAVRPRTRDEPRRALHPARPHSGVTAAGPRRVEAPRHRLALRHQVDAGRRALDAARAGRPGHQRRLP